MSYFNHVYVVFNSGSQTPLDMRFAGRILPKGSVPLAVMNVNKGFCVLVNNDIEYHDVKEYLLKVLPEDHKKEILETSIVVLES